LLRRQYTVRDRDREADILVLRGEALPSTLIEVPLLPLCVLTTAVPTVLSRDPDTYSY
jgi:hypothetical protein